jgi:hypothetical protein
MTNKKRFLDLFFFVLAPSLVYFAPVSIASQITIVIIITFSLLWLVLRVADFHDRPRQIGSIGEDLK